MFLAYWGLRTQSLASLQQNPELSRVMHRNTKQVDDFDFIGRDESRPYRISFPLVHSLSPLPPCTPAPPLHL